MTPTTDDGVREAIRKLGYPALMTECMIGLYEVLRAQCYTVLDAYQRTLFAALPNETVRRLAHNGDESAKKELARRDAQ